MENKLIIYPSSRAIRAKKEEFLKINSFLPKMITIADFESRVLSTPFKMVDSLHRTLFLKEASKDDEFKRLYIDKNLIKFYTQSDDFFKFFEELALERVKISDLYYADTYAEFEKDLKLLEKLLNNYKKLLLKDGYIDKAFLPEFYDINWDFIDGFDSIELILEGFLTRFEFGIFDEIAQKKPFFIELRTNSFNKKMQDEFNNLGFNLESNYKYRLDLSNKKIVFAQKLPLNFNNIEVVECAERLEQLAVAFAKIEEFVKSGIEPQKIALLVPDEEIVSLIDIFDEKKNFNFAMGRAYNKERSFTLLNEIYNFLKGSSLSKEFLQYRGFDFDLLKKSDKEIDIEAFFEKLKELKIPPYDSENFEEELDKLNLLKKFFNFKRVFKSYRFDFKEWLFFWLDILNKHSLDDVRGGKVTVLGVLETRGIDFDAVVIIDFNEGIVPSIVGKDRFLNSLVRKFAKLPTKADRENLQKYYYSRVLERAKRVAVCYVKSDEESPSKFLYELNLQKFIKKYKVNLNIFYPQEVQYNPKAHLNDVEVEFNPFKITWSNSKLKSYLECKRRFYYRYILNIKEEQSKEQSDGSILHATLAKLFRRKDIDFGNPYELKRAFLIELESYKKDIGFDFKSSLWLKLLEGFLKHQIEHFKRGWEIFKIEEPYKNKIAGLDFEGRVDRIDKRGDDYLIIDYKSSNASLSNSSNLEKLSDFQMLIYKKIIDLPSQNQYFAFLDILESKGFIELDMIEEKEEKLLEHLEKIKSQKSFVASRCENLQICRFCSYKLMCHRGEYL